MELTAVDALRILQQELAAGGIETPPKGWKTSMQHAVESGLSRVHAGAILRRAVEAGKAEVKTFRVLAGSRVLPVPHYRVKL